MIDTKKAVADMYKEMREKANDTIYYAKTRVRCVDTGIVYNSLSQAAQDTGCSKSHISAVCNGKLKTARGMRFEFEDDWAVKFRKDKPKAKVKRKYTKNEDVYNTKKRYEDIEWSNQKKIYCWSNGEKYNSAREASRKLGIPVSSILRNCKVNEGVEDDDNLKYMRNGYAFQIDEEGWY